MGSGHELDRSSIELDLDCLRSDCLNPQDKNPEIFITSEEIQWAEGFMLEQKIDSSKKLVIVHPSSYKDWNNNWGLERFVTLSHQLIHDHGHQVLACFPKKSSLLLSYFSTKWKELRYMWGF